MGVVAQVALIHADNATRESLAGDLHAHGFVVRAFGSAFDFLSLPDRHDTGCVVCELDAAGMEMQRKLAEYADQIPLVFLGNQPSIRDVVKVMRAGALHVFEHPVDGDELRAVVKEAIDLRGKRKDDDQRRAAARERLSTLTRREREVFNLVVAGFSSKEIAEKLFLSDKTVQLYRAMFSRKLQCRGVADQVRLAMLAGD